jgi:protein-disulfide isomerase
MPRRGRLWIVVILTLALVALGYSIVNISTQKAGPTLIKAEGVSEAQEIFGGVPQEGDRLGSSDAPVTIEVFNDLQCGNCREGFLSTIPALTEKYARAGSVKLLYRHYSNSENQLEKGFYGAEAAAEQGYGWEYTYLFFRNQEEAKNVTEKRFKDFIYSMAGGVEELNLPEWESTLEEAEASNESAIANRLNDYAVLGENLGIRYGQAMIVNGPGGTRTLQENPSLAEAEAAIGEVE